MKKQIRTLTLVVIGLTCVFLGVQRWIYYHPGNIFYRKYQQVQVGMTLSQLHHLFARSPDYVCKFNGAQIVYYTRGGRFDKKPAPLVLPLAVQKAEQIPYLYGSGQFLFNSQGILVAYTCCGEELNVHTTQGNFSGGDIRVIGDPVLKELIALQ